MNRRRFQDLVVPHADALWSVARRACGDDASADDVLQQALLTALVRIDELREPAAARRWATRIVVRTYLDGERRRRPEAGGSLADVVGSGADPEHALASRRASEQIDAAFDALPSDQRAAVWLVDAEGFTFAEAAETLGVAPGTAASRVARGRSTLRRLLAGLHEPRRQG